MAYTYDLTPAGYTLDTALLNAVAPVTVIQAGATRGDGAAGTYPTTATSKAEQLAADQATVLESADVVISGNTILFQAGTFDLTADRAAVAAATTAEIVSTLNANKSEMIPANTEIQAAIGGVEAGTASTGGLTAEQTAQLAALAGLLNEAGTAFTAEAMVNASGNPSSGARTVTITITDDSAASLENVRVRVTSGVETYVDSTNSSGQVVFHLDDATWSVAVTKSGYTLADQSLVVNGDEAQTYAMATETFTASDPDFVTGYLYCYDAAGAVEQGVEVKLALYSITGTGRGYAGTVRTATSDATGLVQFTNLLPGAQYMICRGLKTSWKIEPSGTYAKDETATEHWTRVSIASDAVNTVALGNLVGED